MTSQTKKEIDLTSESFLIQLRDRAIARFLENKNSEYMTAKSYSEAFLMMIESMGLEITKKSK